MHNVVQSKRNKFLGALVSLFLVISTIGVIATFFHSATTAAHAAGGTGATLPYVELEAHNSTTNGTILGPEYTLGNLASDAVDRQAV